uniref:Histidine-containing phosphotransfer protein n=1 Tax=Opuntia streptacantha TaxID=393608 RepID=A0A7C9CU91_OPUST
MNTRFLQQQIAQLRKSFFEQGYLDEQFIQLEELEDDDNPNFVEEVVTSYFSDSARLIRNIDQALVKRPVDFDKLDDYMHQFKGSSSSIGAKKVVDECLQFREYCAARNAEGCMKTFEMIKQEHALLRKKLEAYFQLVNSAGGI